MAKREGQPVPKPLMEATTAISVAPVMGAVTGGRPTSWRVHTTQPETEQQPSNNTIAAATPTTTVVENSVPDFFSDNVETGDGALIPIDSVSMSSPPPTSASQGATTPQSEGNEPTPEIAPTPEIPGIGRIQRNNKKDSSAPHHHQAAPQKKKERIIIPDRTINGGLDTKFETDPHGLDLCGLMTPEEYTDEITRLNDILRPSRSDAVDAGLLATGPLIVPLAIWGVRHNNNVKKRKQLLMEGIEDFNERYPTLYMRYNKSPASYLSIERRHNQQMTTGMEESWMQNGMNEGEHILS